MGLHSPRTAVLQIVDEATPKQTSTDRIERATPKLGRTNGRAIRGAVRAVARSDRLRLLHATDEACPGHTAFTSTTAAPPGLR
jgi:hypothetical protein